MGVLKKLLIVFGAIIAIFVISSFFIPKDYSVERTITIDAEPSDVYPYVVDLREWKNGAFGLNETLICSLPTQAQIELLACARYGKARLREMAKWRLLN